MTKTTLMALLSCYVSALVACLTNVALENWDVNISRTTRTLIALGLTVVLLIPFWSLMYYVLE